MCRIALLRYKRYQRFGPRDRPTLIERQASLDQKEEIVFFDMTYRQHLPLTKSMAV